MNAYFIITRENDYTLYHQSEIEPVEYGPCWGLVFAETPGKAKYLFWRKYHRAGFEWTDSIKIRTVARNVDRAAGFAKIDDALWLESMTKRDRAWVLRNEPDYYRDYPAGSAVK